MSVDKHTNKINITLQGHSFVVRSDLPPEKLQRIVADLNHRLDERTRRSYDAVPLHITLLVALQLTEELYLQKEKMQQFTDDVEMRLGSMLGKLNQILDNAPAPHQLTDAQHNQQHSSQDADESDENAQTETVRDVDTDAVYTTTTGPSRRR